MFGVQLCERGLAKTVGLVPCAVGGTEIDEWKEGSHLFNRMARFPPCHSMQVYALMTKTLLNDLRMAPSFNVYKLTIGSLEADYLRSSNARVL